MEDPSSTTAFEARVMWQMETADRVSGLLKVLAASFQTKRVRMQSAEKSLMPMGAHKPNKSKENGWPNLTGQEDIYCNLETHTQ